MEKILVARSSMPTYEEYIEAIKPLWESHWLTNMGQFHKQFEKELRGFFNMPQVSLVVNGHMALELAIQSMGFARGSEVITTPYTFISTTHAIVRNGLQPVFCDIKPEDGTIDENKIERLITPKTAAILPVHVYGNPCNVKKIEEIALKYNLKVIYDAAHAFGVTYQGKSLAAFGDMACFSFHATKVFNSIEGGAIVYEEEEVYEKIHDLRNFGIRGEELVVETGANAKMNEFAAIMGLLNLKHFSSEIEKRKRVETEYRKYLSGVEGVRILLNEDEEIQRNYAYFPVVIDADVLGYTRDEIYDRLKIHDIYSRKYFYPLTTDQICYKNRFEDADVKQAREIAAGVLALPFYADLTMESVKNICEIICG